MAGGRPSPYKEEYCKQAKKLCLLGADDKRLADFFEVCVATIYKWKNDYPEFSDAIKDGKENADAAIANSLYHRAKGYSHKEDKIFSNGTDKDGNPLEPTIVPTVKNYPPDTAAAIFWLKNRQKVYWRDKQEVEHGLSDSLTDLLASIDGKDTGLPNGDD